MCTEVIYNNDLFPLQQNCAVFITLFYLLLTPDVAANPINQKGTTKEVASKLQNESTSKSPASLKYNTKLKSFPIMTNGAFGSVNMINQNALTHKLNKKIDDKKKVDIAKAKVDIARAKVDIANAKRVKPTHFPLCLSLQLPTAASTAVPGFNVNTLFMSRNWGH